MRMVVCCSYRCPGRGREPHLLKVFERMVQQEAQRRAHPLQNQHDGPRLFCCEVKLRQDPQAQGKAHHVGFFNFARSPQLKGLEQQRQSDSQAKPRHIPCHPPPASLLLQMGDV